MKFKVTDLKRNMMGIYKISFPNGKIYVGLSNDIKRRLWEHNDSNKACSPCDFAIRKYGKVEEIEILEFVNDRATLVEREIFWIKELNARNREKGYNITAGGDGASYGEDNHNSAFSNEEVLQIRRRRFEGERKKEVYKNFESYSFGTFEKVWLGRGYPGIGEEFIIPTGSITRQEYSSRANTGENNNKAKLNEKKVLEIRERFSNGETPSEIHKDYTYVARNTISRVCNRTTWKHVR